MTELTSETPFKNLTLMVYCAHVFLYVCVLMQVCVCMYVCMDFCVLYSRVEDYHLHILLEFVKPLSLALDT